MAELPSNILSALTNVPHNARLARAYLDPKDLAPGETPPWNSGGGASGNAIALQYWPETLQDSRGGEWSPKNVPGGSHPLYQWTNGGERRLSFTAVFTTDTAPPEDVLANINVGNLPAGSILSAGSLGGSSDPYQFQRTNPLSGYDKNRDIDLRAAVSWLRWFTYPYYDEATEWKAYEPAKALLVMPNTGIGYDATDYVTTVMTGCEVTYEAFFDSGFPRILEVSLEFAEVVQSGQRVRFHNRRNMGYATHISKYLSVQNDK